MKIMVTTGLIFLSLLVLATGSAFAEASIMSHQAQLVFDVDSHTVIINDHLDIPEGVKELRLGDQLSVVSISRMGKKSVDPTVAVSRGEDEDGLFQMINLEACGLSPAGGQLDLQYSGYFFESVEKMTFSRENIGNEITATISQEGIYLSGMAEWLPWAEDVMVTHDLSIDTPAGFESVTQGERTEHELRGDRLHSRWVARYPSDGLNLIANKYFVHEEPVKEGIISQTFFLEDDARLRATYMERTKAYIAMYEEMIGPYPYKKFATVENWFPTGYGMPSYTLLGGTVLRLPFIPYTSFGHEICHNWWGNSVFVDISEGNWCEGLTVYCADYHYKKLKSDEEARQYRRTTLKDYAAYTRDSSNDFPLAEFMSRHSGATRAVGYGKSMMVFHMVENLIGREAFVDGLQAVAKDHKYAQTNWSDFFAAFETASGKDFSDFQKQWLTRTGAPILALEDVEFDGDKVSFKLRQGAPPYDLQVPVVLDTAEGAVEKTIHFNKMSQKFELKAEKVRSVSIDPGTNLFRRLHLAEIEPTLSQVLAEMGPTIVLDHAPNLMVQAAHKFASEFLSQPLYAIVENGELPADTKPGSGTSSILINPGTELLGKYQNSELMISGNTFFLGGKRYNLKDYDLVFTGTNPYDSTITDLIILCNSPHRLESYARRLGHYGKYSYLIFPAGNGSPTKGNWPLSDSPLTVKRP